MSFTDDDLRRLKDESSSDFPRMGTPPYLAAIIARLEAAETLANLQHMLITGPVPSDAELGKQAAIAFEQWRKVAGK